MKYFDVKKALKQKNFEVYHNFTRKHFQELCLSFYGTMACEITAPIRQALKLPSWVLPTPVRPAADPSPSEIREGRAKKIRDKRDTLDREKAASN